jgi:alkylresorcinol/alkylpyrone synthase
MGWHIEEDGLGVLFSRDIPTLVRTQFREATDGFLRGRGLTLADIDGFICHPGGAKVITALEESFGVPEGTLDDARAVLRQYGNMSAATVMFVLERMDWRAKNKRTMLTTLGPGFSAAFLTLDSR